MNENNGLNQEKMTSTFDIGFCVDDVQNQIDICNNALRNVNKRLEGAPVGRIIPKNIRGKLFFYKRIPQSDSEGKTRLECVSQNNSAGKTALKYISQNNREEIAALLDKRYCENLSIDLTAEIKALEHIQKHYSPEKKYNAAKLIPPEFRAAVPPLFIPIEEKIQTWQNRPYIANSFPVDEKSCYTTSRNETVRSRMEYIIADNLAARGLAYHYEEQLLLCDKLIYPDFTIMHPKTGELYYLEFFGMMSDPSYSEKALSKVRRYQYAGLGPQLIAIFESNDSPFQTKTLKKILDTYFGEA